jgi:hypothetical protein
LRDKGLQSSTVAPWPSLQNFGENASLIHSRQFIPAESLLTLAFR